MAVQLLANPFICPRAFDMSYPKKEIHIDKRYKNIFSMIT
jgi:hypothetical protein